MSDRSGLVHRGLLYDSPPDLADAVGPAVRDALDDGQVVFAMVDDAVASALRAGLGPRADRIRFQARTSAPSGRTPAVFLGMLRAWSGSDRRTLVVGHYSAITDDPGACAEMEDGINLLLRDRPVTVLCACSRAEDPARRETVRRSHPAWVSGRAEHPNTGFRAPEDRSPATPEVWGRLVLRTSFRGLADLARIRHQVIEVVSEMGIRGTDADAAVLAVHEAAALTCRAGHDTGAPVEPDDEERTVEVRATGTSLFSEVRAPGPPGAGRSAEAHSLLGQVVCDADELRHLTWFCRRAAVHDRGGAHTVRVLVDSSVAGVSPDRTGKVG